MPSTNPRTGLETANQNGIVSLNRKELRLRMLKRPFATVFIPPNLIFVGIRVIARVDAAPRRVKCEVTVAPSPLSQPSNTRRGRRLHSTPTLPRGRFISGAQPDIDLRRQSVVHGAFCSDLHQTGMLRLAQ